jgi:hypothetical protein
MHLSVSINWAEVCWFACDLCCCKQACYFVCNSACSTGNVQFGTQLGALDERVGGLAKGTRFFATARTSGHGVVYPSEIFVVCTVGVRTQQSRSNVNCGLSVVSVAGSVNRSSEKKTYVLKFLPETQSCVPNCAG